MLSESTKRPLACVMGNIDLVRPLGLTGIQCVVIGPSGDPAFYSRFVEKELSWENSISSEEQVEKLIQFGLSQSEPPVLFYQFDTQLLLVSHNRERLSQAFRFVIADAALVEDLVDKAKFQALAERLGLPVPAARQIHPYGSTPAEIELRFPIIIKPIRRWQRWNSFEKDGKAVLVESMAEMRQLWPRMVAADVELLVQEAILGPESQIESYHTYIDESGSVVAEFTGRKIRTYPTSCGHSTALELTDAADVTELGRDISRTINLRGVAKFDFKRDSEGNLHLLEINPRFNLWHHLGAVAGVNLPAIVYADLTSGSRPAKSHARSGVRWCKLWGDVRAAREAHIPVTTWLPWALSCEAKSAMSWDDPMPLLLGALARVRSRKSDSSHAR